MRRRKTSTALSGNIQARARSARRTRRGTRRQGREGVPTGRDGKGRYPGGQRKQRQRSAPKVSDASQRTGHTQPDAEREPHEGRPWTQVATRAGGRDPTGQERAHGRERGAVTSLDGLRSTRMDGCHVPVTALAFRPPPSGLPYDFTFCLSYTPWRGVCLPNFLSSCPIASATICRLRDMSYLPHAASTSSVVDIDNLFNHEFLKCLDYVTLWIDWYV